MLCAKHWTVLLLFMVDSWSKSFKSSHGYVRTQEETRICHAFVWSVSPFRTPGSHLQYSKGISWADDCDFRESALITLFWMSIWMSIMSLELTDSTHKSSTSRSLIRCQYYILYCHRPCLIAPWICQPPISLEANPDPKWLTCIEQLSPIARICKSDCSVNSLKSPRR